MGNRKRAPVLAHLLAAFMGMGLDPELAKDYWLGHEEPWSAKHDVRNRFAKLAYMYIASAIVQAGVPGFSIIAISGIIRTPRGEALQIPGVILGVAVGLALIAIGAGIILAFFEWRAIVRKRESIGGGNNN